MASGSSSTISSLGVGSNLDLGSLLDSLKSAEQSRLTPLQQRKASYSAELSAYGTLTAAVTSLQGATDKLANRELFQATQVAVDGNGLTATSDAQAVPGRYEVSITQRARAQSLVAPPVADPNTPTGAGGQLVFSVGDASAVTIELSAEQSSLSGIRDAINAADAGVSATIVDDGSDTPYRLVITAQDSGKAHQISITATDTQTDGATPLADLLDYDSESARGAMQETVAAADATLQVNGVAITRSSNTIVDAIPGVTLELTAVSDAPSQVTVSRDDDSVKSAVQGFISAYNRYQGIVSGLTAFKGDDTSGNGLLLGDATTRSVTTQLRQVLGTSNTQGSLRRLDQAGIQIELDGTLSLDEKTFDKALTQDPAGLAALFAGSGDRQSAAPVGLAGRLSETIAGLTDDQGLLKTASDGLDRRIGDIDDRLATMQTAIDATVERYRQQFVRLDTLVSNLNATQSYLTTQLAQLGQRDSS